MAKLTNAEIKANQEDWLKRLESGRYKQTSYLLIKKTERSGYSYCCLGVAMVALGRERVSVASNAIRSLLGFVSDERYDGLVDTELDRAAADALGLVSINGAFDAEDLKRKNPKLYAKLRDDGTDTMSLVYLNDEGVSFKTLAKIIRAKPKGLFKPRKALFD